MTRMTQTAELDLIDALDLPPASTASPQPLRFVKRLRKRRATKAAGYEKVFGIGAPRTGTSSLAEGFFEFGFKFRGWDPYLWECLQRGLYDAIFEVADQYEAFKDGPWNGGDFYRLLDERYPGSKFILTVRDTESWSRSHERHFSASGGTKIPERYRILDYERRRDDFIDEYLRRNAEIVEYFADRPESLLVIDIRGGDGWEKLAPFLGFRVPKRPFPHTD
jgi:hypothetical protein